MRLIIGGRCMGTLEYAERLLGEGSGVPSRNQKAPIILCDLSEREPDDMFGAKIIYNLQAGVRFLLKRGDSGVDFFRRNMGRLRDKILVGDEVGGGVVPLDPFERLWRDETGFLYQYLAAEADAVDRVWAGIPQRLKG